MFAIVGHGPRRPRLDAPVGQGGLVAAALSPHLPAHRIPQPCGRDAQLGGRLPDLQRSMPLITDETGKSPQAPSCDCFSVGGGGQVGGRTGLDAAVKCPVQTGVFGQLLFGQLLTCSERPHRFPRSQSHSSTTRNPHHACLRWWQGHVRFAAPSGSSSRHERDTLLPSKGLRVGAAGHNEAPAHGSSATARRGAPLPPLIFIGSAISSAPRTGSRSSAVRFSNTGMSRADSTRCVSKMVDCP